MDPENSKFDNSKIENLRSKLYSRDENLIQKEERSTMEKNDIDVQTTWGDERSFQMTQEDMTKKGSNSFFNKFLLGSLVFFVISLSVAAFIFFGGINMISSNNLDVKIVAPNSISSGEELTIGLSIINGNRTDIEDVVLFIDYPEGSQAINSDKPLTHDKANLGIIPSGGSTEYSIRNMLFGEKDSIKTFVFRIEYKVKGSNATFSKEKTFDVSIGSSPILFEINYPKEINSGQEIKMTINVTSNSSFVLKNSLIKIDYPYGFTYKSSSIKPLRDNSIWNIGDLKNGDKKTLVVSGTIVGQNEEDKTFRISSGLQSTDNSKDFDASLADEDITVGIRKSFFNLQLVVTEIGLREIGQYVPVLIKWQNTLPDKVVNAKIQAKLSGNILDRTRVSVGDGGFFQSIDNTILWDKNNNDSFSDILPGNGGEVSMSLVSITDPIEVRKIRNPHMDIHVVMTGFRAGDDTVPVFSEGDIVIKLVSTLSLTAKTYRNVGPFSNTGSIPPKADKETTYTVTWTLTNTTNDLSGVVVKTKLLDGVVWKGETSPLSEKISYDPDTKTISWNVGSVSAGVGFTNSPRGVSFKIGLTPSVNQINSTPYLTGETRAVAVDTYTNTTISSINQSLSTEYSDPGYKSGDSIVAK